MRLHRHDLRDFKLAFGLAFDLTRLTYSGLAVCWTVFVAAGAGAIMSLGADTDPWSGSSWVDAWAGLAEAPRTPLNVLLLACVLGSWWVGFRWLCGPVWRSAAMDIARDERERKAMIPPLNRQAALAPVLGLLIVAIAFGVGLLWALTTSIPGTAGAIVSGILLPLALLATLLGAAMMFVLLLALPMIGPTAMIEGRDYFEALTRPMSYVMQRPGAFVLAFLVRVVTVAISAAIGAAVLAGAWAMLAGAMWVVGQGEVASHVMDLALGNTAPGHTTVAFALAMGLWASVGVLACWVLAVRASSDSVLYMLMRYRVDGIPFDAIMIAEDKLKQVKSAMETAEEAEEARKRGDRARDAEPAPAAADEAAQG